MEVERVFLGSPQGPLVGELVCPYIRLEAFHKDLEFVVILRQGVKPQPIVEYAPFIIDRVVQVKVGTVFPADTLFHSEIHRPIPYLMAFQSVRKHLSASHGRDQKQ
jgi:hypothetical protein